MLNTTELRQNRAAIVDEMRKHHMRVVETGEESGEDVERYQKMEKDIRALEITIEREEKLQAEEKKLAAIADEQRQRETPAQKFESIRYPTLAQHKATREEVER